MSKDAYLEVRKYFVVFEDVLCNGQYCSMRCVDHCSIKPIWWWWCL